MNKYYGTPYGEVVENYKLPFDLFPFQVDTVNELALYDKAGYYFDPGLGKTSTATVSALYKLLQGEADQVVVIVPPMVIPTWARWLEQIPEVTKVIYRGTPKERQALKLNAQFIVVGIQIFKKDYDRFVKELGQKRLVVLVDEAHSLKNVSSDNFKKVSAFQADKHLMLLTGTPVTSPRDVYAYCKLIAPTIYRGLGHFDNLHVGARDFFGNVTSWRHLDLLSDNLKVNSRRILKEEVLEDLPEVTYTPLFYDLDPNHLKLYSTLAEQQILKLESGGKIDATNSSALYSALQQIVINWDHFSADPSKVSEGLKLIDYVMEEIGDRKLLIFSNYRMTNRKVRDYCQKYGVAAAFGDNTVPQNLKEVDRFVKDPKVRVLVGQPASVGVGVDGLQKVCSDVLYLESPVVPRDFYQSLSRVHRQGQRNGVNVRIGIAQRTIQVRLHKRLMDKDEIVNYVQGGFQDLRNAIYGD